MEQEQNNKLQIGSMSNKLATITDEQNKALKIVIANTVSMIVGTNNINTDDSKLVYFAIKEHYKHLPLEHIVNALKKGSVGKFGILHKVTPMIICSWVDKYMATNPPYVDVDDWFFRTRGQSIEEICEEKGFDVKQTREHQTKLFNEKFKR